ncbi:MAG: ribose 5-phosphate isomerase B [Oscillospiraceae bacterium]|jgi:ribose 5-phosphate isomerase B|nr:ribose 5-phosphate isomerase B [Oscillospiraceae bacterium]
MMHIAIGCDHAAIELKNELTAHLAARDLVCRDFGAYAGEKADYPKIAFAVGEAVAAGDYPLGILLCGTGVGISIAANKVKGIRAVCCSEPFSAKMSREHNNANILCMGARVVGAELAKMIADAWLTATFQGDRHAARVDMICAYEDSV